MQVPASEIWPSSNADEFVYACSCHSEFCNTQRHHDINTGGVSVTGENDNFSDFDLSPLQTRTFRPFAYDLTEQRDVMPTVGSIKVLYSLLPDS